MTETVRAVVLIEPHFPQLPETVQAIPIMDLSVQRKSGTVTMLRGEKKLLTGYFTSCSEILMTNQDTGAWHAQTFD